MLQKNWTDLIKPNKLDIAGGNNPARQATVVAEPLERGFGLTLGNALRRILLSSLQGAAVRRSKLRVCCTNSLRSRVRVKTSPTSSST